MSRIYVTNMCHEYMSRIYVTNICHEYMSRIYVTNICHEYMSRIYVTNMCHEYVSRICVTNMSRIYVTNMSRTYVTNMSRIYVTNMCNEYMSRICVTNMCHEYMSRIYATNMCHEYTGWRASRVLVERKWQNRTFDHEVSVVIPVYPSTIIMLSGTTGVHVLGVLHWIETVLQSTSNLQRCNFLSIIARNKSQTFNMCSSEILRDVGLKKNVLAIEDGWLGTNLRSSRVVHRGSREQRPSSWKLGWDAH